MEHHAYEEYVTQVSYAYRINLKLTILINKWKSKSFIKEWLILLLWRHRPHSRRAQLGS